MPQTANKSEDPGLARLIQLERDIATTQTDVRGIGEDVHNLGRAFKDFSASIDGKFNVVFDKINQKPNPMVFIAGFGIILTVLTIVSGMMMWAINSNAKPMADAIAAHSRTLDRLDQGITDRAARVDRDAKELFEKVIRLDERVNHGTAGSRLQNAQ